MKSLIVISGAPGSGKSTIAELLKDKLQSPYIDFGWLREFHLDKEWKNAGKDEESMAFENLVFILKNYIKHGYKNVVITDLEDSRVQEISKYFRDEKYIIISLTIENDEELKNRISGRDSGFKNIEEALNWNRNLKTRKALANECKIDNTHNNPNQILEEILKLV